MATKKTAPKKPTTPKATKAPPAPPAPPVPTMRGLRRVEALTRQLERWQEKWPMADNAGEWLKFAAAGQASLKLLELDARRQLGDLGPQSRMDVVRGGKKLSHAEQTMAGRVADDADDEG